MYIEITRWELRRQWIFKKIGQKRGDGWGNKFQNDQNVIQKEITDKTFSIKQLSPVTYVDCYCFMPHHIAVAPNSIITKKVECKQYLYFLFCTMFTAEASAPGTCLPCTQKHTLHRCCIQQTVKHSMATVKHTAQKEITNINNNVKNLQKQKQTIYQ